MNKTLIAIGFFILVGLGIIGTAVLLIYRPEQVPTFIGAITTLLGIGTAAVVTIYGLGQQGKTLDTIKTNTNGTLTALREEIAQLRAERDEVLAGRQRGDHAA